MRSFLPLLSEAHSVALEGQAVGNSGKNTRAPIGATEVSPSQGVAQEGDEPVISLNERKLSLGCPF
jgi:hypothetical protein